MRPTFEILFPIATNTAIDRLCLLLDDADYPVEGRIAGTHLMLVIPPDRRHFWSPWLQIEVHKKNTDTTDSALIHGRFSPNPSVWTGYMLGYISLLTLIFFASMFAIAQWMMDKPPKSLMIIPVLVAIGAVMYWSSLIGQKIANAQMHELYDASMGALADESESHSDKPSPSPEPQGE